MEMVSKKVLTQIRHWPSYCMRSLLVDRKDIDRATPIMQAGWLVWSDSEGEGSDLDNQVAAIEASQLLVLHYSMTPHQPHGASRDRGLADQHYWYETTSGKSQWPWHSGTSGTSGAHMNGRKGFSCTETSSSFNVCPVHRCILYSSTYLPSRGIKTSYLEEV